MKKQVTVALAGLGSRGKDTYVPAAKLFPDRMKIVAIADKEAGISDRSYYDTFRDMEIWYRHCLKETGIPGMKQYQWTSLPIKRKIYRLGRLQYEPSRLKDENWEEGKEIPVLEVHIPEGEPLDVQAVKDSFKEAAGFFEEVVSYKYDGFHCESWLLSPQLHNLLSKQSNILRFQDLFFVYNEIPARQAEERVFGKVTDRIEEYPEDTSLQRALKAYLQKGNKVGMGCGFIEPEGPD